MSYQTNSPAKQQLFSAQPVAAEKLAVADESIQELSKEFSEGNTSEFAEMLAKSQSYQDQSEDSNPLAAASDAQIVKETNQLSPFEGTNYQDQLDTMKSQSPLEDQRKKVENTEREHPAHTTELLNTELLARIARDEEMVAAELESVRAGLMQQRASIDVAMSETDIHVLEPRIVNQGRTGVYLFNFFHVIRQSLKKAAQLFASSPKDGNTWTKVGMKNSWTTGKDAYDDMHHEKYVNAGG